MRSSCATPAWDFLSQAAASAAIHSGGFAPQARSALLKLFPNFASLALQNDRPVVRVHDALVLAHERRSRPGVLRPVEAIARLVVARHPRAHEREVAGALEEACVGLGGLIAHLHRALRCGDGELA